MATEHSTVPMDDPLTDSTPAIGLTGFTHPDAPEDSPAPPRHVEPSHTVKSEDGHTARADSFDSPFGSAPMGVIGRHKVLRRL